MNITNWGSIPNLANQAAGAPQAGPRCGPSAAMRSSGRDVTPGTDISGVGTLKSLDEAARQGYREDYSIWDAADSLWQKETQTFNLKDLEDPEKSKEFLENWRVQVRWDLGIQGGGPTKDEVIADYIQELRQNGLSGEVDFSVLTRELNSFKATTPEELEDGLNYMASRYVAALDKLERGFTGDELTARRARLEAVYQAGKAGMIDGYARLLQDNLGISDSDAQAVRDSFSAILAEKEEAYRGALQQVHEAVAQTGPDSVWLKNHDAYIASQLRAAAGASGPSEARYSVQDLTAAGRIAQDYRAEIDGASSCGRNEVTLALGLSAADMKAEAMISKGLVSGSMAALLRSSRTRGHENALAALDRALAHRESHRATGEPKGTYAPADSAVFRGIYDAVMSAFHQNGGDAAKAIQAGASAGEKLTDQAAARVPKAARWGVSMRSYWQEFYKVPEERTTVLGLQIRYLTNQKPRSSTYQKYVNSWQDFLASIGGRVDMRA
nr:hypothetical protein [uncultured Oscillibacter sp.]